VAFFLEGTVGNRKDFFNRHASTWDKELQYEGKTEQLLGVLKWFELSEGDSVLDVGTGTGILLPIIKEAIGLKGMLIAMDFSLQMLEQARLRQHVDEKILINASVAAIPFRSNQFDRLTCFAAFPHFPDKPRALSEMVRVLRNGGKLFIAHLHSVEEINQLHQQVGGPVADDLLPQPERIRSLMADSGLSGVSIINQPGKFLARGQKG
jgi:ubiquinone/menaquinone biosynthesis C-methylase UbiE